MTHAVISTLTLLQHFKKCKFEWNDSSKESVYVGLDDATPIPAKHDMAARITTRSEGYCSSQSPVFSQLKNIAPTRDYFTCPSTLSEYSCKMFCKAWKKRTLFLLLSFKNYVLKKIVHVCGWLWSTRCGFCKPNSSSTKVVHALNWEPSLQHSYWIKQYFLLL